MQTIHRVIKTDNTVSSNVLNASTFKLIEIESLMANWNNKKANLKQLVLAYQDAMRLKSEANNFIQSIRILKNDNTATKSKIILLRKKPNDLAL